MTNGLHASAGLYESWFGGRRVPGTPSIRLWLCSDHRQVLVQVWDGNHQLPVRQDAGPEAEGGRGLLLVESLSAECGSYRPERSSGKVVWAVIETTASPQRDDAPRQLLNRPVRSKPGSAIPREDSM